MPRLRLGGGAERTSVYDSDIWGDLLTVYNNLSLTYDNIGNVLSDGTWTYTWQQGRQLATMHSGGITWTFTYDANGMRTSRYSNGGTEYTYVYNGSQLRMMTYGSNTLYFSYDAAGAPMTVNYNGTTYYYVTNLQGDVIAILNDVGTAMVQYTYDAWGNVLTTTGSMVPTLGLYNPLRYRGYVYDRETGLYYLQSRYYNPIWGRFINADRYASTGQGFLGYNMFAYCNNNPVIYKDSTGNFLCTAIGALVGAAFGALSAVIEEKTGDDFWASVANGAVSGSISGLAADVLLVTGGSAGVVVGVMAVAGALGSIAGNIVESRIAGDPMNISDTVADACWDAASGALFGYMGGPITSNMGKFASKGVWKASRQLIIREIKDMGSSLIEGSLEEITTGIGQFIIDVFCERIVGFTDSSR